MDLTKDQVNKILQNAPAGADKRKILDGLVQRGYALEGVDPARQQNVMAARETAQTMEGNAFEEKPKGFFGRLGDIGTSILGGKKLAQGAGMAIAAPNLQSSLSEAEMRNSDTQLELVKAIREKKAAGEDTTRLQNALDALSIGQAETRDVQQDFAEALPGTKEVVGSSLRLAGTLAGGAIAGAMAPATKATGIVAGIGQGARVGALTGAAEGAIQGAGIGLEKDLDAKGVLGASVGGAALGAATGGLIGGVAGGVSGKIAKTKALAAQKEEILRTRPDSTVARYTLDGQGKIANDPVAQEAIKQGVDESIVAAIKGSSAADRQKAAKALDILEKGKTNANYRAINRPSDVIGESAMSRFSAVAKANEEAGKRLDAVAGSLKGKKADPVPAVQAFIDDLDGLGVSFQNGKAVYRGSDIEGLNEPQRILNAVIKRMSEVSDDASELHKLKRFIDENVAYGKASEGLSGRAEGIVKGLRANIDRILDDGFPEYNQVNTQYSRTRNAIDTFSDLAGTRFDPKSPNATKKIGTLARRILSNAQSRTDVLESLDELQKVAQEYGAKFDDDIVTQTVFVNELERLFGTSAPTSIAGEFTKGVNQAKGMVQRMKSSQGLIDLALQAGAEGIERAKGINEEGLIKALREIVGS